SSPTTTLPTTTTTVPANNPGGSTGGGNNSFNPGNPGGNNSFNPGNPGGNSFSRPVLGQPMPPILPNTPGVAPTTRSTGNSVTFNVPVKPGAIVNIYRNGILVSSVPASAAAALKVSNNPAGANSYQVVVVQPNGEIAVSEKTTVVAGQNSGPANVKQSPTKNSSNGSSKTGGKNGSKSKASTSKNSK
ncbi:MAG: hypothetical protein ACKOGG_06955, partial [Actinomycetota bacterium]